MAISLGTALAYALAPAALGYGVAAVVFSGTPSVAGPGSDQARRIKPIVYALPLTGIVFAFVAAFLASQEPNGEELAMPLLVVGIVAGAVAAAQGAMARMGWADVAADPQRFGRFLVRIVALDVGYLAAFLFFILRWQSA